MARIFVGLPVAGGYYPQMIGSLIPLLQQNPGQHELKFVTLANESLISRARNTLASMFLESDCEYMLSIDADLEFPVDAIDRLVAHDKDIVAAPYTLKGTPPLWTVRFHEGELPPYVAGLMSVRYVSGGFTLVKRRVVEALAKPELRYRNKGNWSYNLYQPYVHEVVSGDPEYLPEDWAFCQRAIDAGFEVHCDFDVRLTHWGMQGYSMVELDGKLPSNPMMPFMDGLNAMANTAELMSAVPQAAPEGDYAALMQNMMASFNEVQGMLADLATGKIQPPEA